MSRHALALLTWMIIVNIVATDSRPLAQTSPAEDTLIKKTRAIHERGTGQAVSPGPFH